MEVLDAEIVHQAELVLNVGVPAMVRRYLTFRTARVALVHRDHAKRIG